jgi:hypothetical protein
MTENKNAILFCTHALWKGTTFKTLKKELTSKGYEVVLCVSKKGMKPDKPEDFSEILAKIEYVPEKCLFCY